MFDENKALEAVTGEAYKDLLQPSFRPLGEIFSLLPRTLKIATRRWEKYLIRQEAIAKADNLLLESLKSVPEDKQCVPEDYVAVPVIQQLDYCFDSEVLRNLYTNLLTSSMNIDKKWNVHPAFIDIIKQLSPDEAKILLMLPRNSTVYKPVIDLKIDQGNEKGMKMVIRNYSNIGYNVCEAEDNIPMYLENLDRLGLIHIPGDGHIVDDSFYQPLVDSPKIKDQKGKITLKENEKFYINKKLLYVTAFGLNFIDCCIQQNVMGMKI